MAVGPGASGAERSGAERGMAPALPDERLITRADLFIRMIQMRCN